MNRYPDVTILMQEKLKTKRFFNFVCENFNEYDIEINTSLNKVKREELEFMLKFSAYSAAIGNKQIKENKTLKIPIQDRVIEAKTELSESTWQDKKTVKIIF